MKRKKDICGNDASFELKKHMSESTFVPNPLNSQLTQNDVLQDIMISQAPNRSIHQLCKQDGAHNKMQQNTRRCKMHNHEWMCLLWLICQFYWGWIYLCRETCKVGGKSLQKKCDSPRQFLKLICGFWCHSWILKNKWAVQQSRPHNRKHNSFVVSKTDNFSSFVFVHLWIFWTLTNSETRQPEKNVKILMVQTADHQHDTSSSLSVLTLTTVTPEHSRAASTLIEALVVFCFPIPLSM